MFDTSILATRIHDNVMDICVNAIVCESFLNAVPISKNDRTQGLNQGLRGYAIESMKDLGGHKLLLEACENERLSETKRAYLNQIKSICMEAADVVTDRILSDSKDDPEALASAANTVAFTPEECEKIGKRVGDVSTGVLSDIIQKNVLDTIKSEKEAYKRDAELEMEIKSALTTSLVDEVTTEDGTATEPEKDPDTAYESYMQSIAGHNYRDRHATLFSRIHEMSLEALLCATEAYTEIPFKTMTLLTKECTFDKFNSSRQRSPLACLESMTYFAMESLATPDGAEVTDDLQNKSLLTASIIYTFFATLQAMNLYCPNLEEIRKVVDERLPLQSKVALDRTVFMKAIGDIVSNSYSALNRTKTVPEVEIVDKNLEMVREKCDHCDVMESDMSMLREKFDEIQKAIDVRRDYLVDKTRVVAAVESDMDIMKRTRDTAKFSRVASSYGRKPNVTMLKCKVDPQGDANMRKYVAVECFAPNGTLAGSTTVVLERALEASELPAYVEASIRGSNIMNLDKSIMITDKRSGKTYMHQTSKRP